MLLLFEVVTDKQVFSTQGNTFKGDKISKGMCFYFLCLLDNPKLLSTSEKKVNQVITNFVHICWHWKKTGEKIKITLEVLIPLNNAYYRGIPYSYD